MADSCIIKYSDVSKIDSIIKELEHNNPTACFKLSTLINSQGFINHVKNDSKGKDVTDLESIGKLNASTIKRLIKEYRNLKQFNVRNTSKLVGNRPLYHFSSYDAFRVGQQYLVDLMANLNVNDDEKAKRDSNYIPKLQDRVKYAVFKRLLDIASQYRTFDNANIRIKVKNEKGKLVTQYNTKLRLECIEAIIDNGTEIEKNYKDFVNTIWSNREFWEEAFNNNKISHLKTSFEDALADEVKASLMFNDEEDALDDVENYDDSVVSNEQWSISETPSNFQKLLSERTKNYFNTLPRLASPIKPENGDYQLDRYNALGVPTYHNYQECSIELLSIMNALGGFKSKKRFIELLKEVANNKKEFAAFAKVADDFEEDDNLFNKVFSDLSGFIFDKLEVRVGENNQIEVGQSNNNNLAVRKMFFNLRNEFKSTAVSNNNVGLNKFIDELIKRYDNVVVKYDNLEKRHDAAYEAIAIKAENDLIEEVKDLFKTYFPSLNENAIDSYIIKNPQPNSKRPRLSNISSLLTLLRELTSSAKITMVEFENQEYIRRKIFGENIKIEQAYQLARANNMNPPKPKLKEYPEFKDYLMHAETVLSKIANAFEPYTYSKAELNSRTVDNKLSSDVGYNNMITNIAKICRDKDLLNVWVKEKLKSTEFDYSNILIDNPAKGIKGLFRKTSTGDYVLTEYGDAIIDVYLLNGAINENTDTSADYKKMSDADYFLTGLYAYKLNTKGYRKYNTDKKYVVPTAPFLMRIPSDAPKNFAINMPKYDLQGLYIFDENAAKDYAKQEYAKLNIHEVEPTDIHIANILMPSVFKNISVEDMAVVMTEGQNTFKITSDNIIEAKGDNITIAFQVTNGNETDYIYYTGTKKKEGKELFIENAKIAYRIGSDTNLGSLIVNRFKDNFKREHYEARQINRNHPIFAAFLNILKGEIFDYYKALEDIKNHKKEDLIEWFHYNPKSKEPLSALTGNAFNFTKLDSKVNIDMDAKVKEILSSTGGKTLLRNYTKDSTNKATIDFSSIEEQLNQLVEQWVKAYEDYSVDAVRDKFKHFVEKLTDNDIVGYMFNSYIHFNNFDDLFEGNSKYYANPQTFLKRAKEAQAGGTAYAISNYNKTETNTNPFSQSVENLGVDLGIQANGKEVGLRSGWYGVTIYNTIRGSNVANNLYEQLIAAGTNEEKAKEIAKGFGLPYTNEKGETSQSTEKVNDAQSYITIYEAARRLKILGEYDKYDKLIKQLTDDTTKLEDINPNELLGFIQVMKNFYFDHYYNEKFGRHLPRQIKNAEYVLVPKFLKGTSLGRLADIMIELDIDQVNTQETSKAANYSTLTFWDNNGEVSEEAIETFRQKAPANKQAYSYMYLYKQQDVPQHILDARNKAGIQVMKKILDNIADFNQAGKNPALNFVNAYVANIKEDFDNLMNRYGIEFDANYNLISKDGKAISYKQIYDLALIETSRLGIDNNMLEYLQLDETGQPIMPNFMNVVASKIESIAQSQFNKFITRQKLPGWHAAQVTSVGLEGYIRQKRGEAVTTDEGKRVELNYHVDSNGKAAAVVEVLLPKWAKSMFNKYDKDGNLIKEVRIEDCDPEVLESLGYRIPTEGKQSMAVLKVVGFLPEWMGSTIVVPDEWVAQTGSDFDVDSIYGISFETYLGKDGRVHKVKYIEGDNEESAFIRYTKYVNEYTSRLINKDFPLHLTEDEYEEIKKKAKAVVLANNKDLEEYYHKEVKNKIEIEQTEAWHKLSEELQDKFKVLQRELKENKVQFKDRVSRILDYIRDLEYQGYDEEALQDFKKAYEGLRDIISEQIDFAHNVYENVGELLKGANKEYFRNSVINRAAAAGLMSFEEFQKLSIEAQNIRKARNNRILDSMIAIMKSKDSLEEQLSRSNFEDITDAIKAVDKLKGTNKSTANVYNLLDQIQFHRNAMSGATLKAFSVARDTGTSVFNVARAELQRPIYVKYGKNVDMNVAKQAFDVDENGVVKHDRIGNSKNNRNVKGDFITVASSHTTAHILDAIKEGAIENENEFTFAAFKTLFDVGIDAYTAVLWIRQPGISRLVKHYYEKQSVFQKGYGNEVYNAIKEIAAELGVKIKGEIVNSNHSIKDVMDALQEQYGKEFGDLYNGSTISFDNKDDSGVNIIDVERMEDNLTGIAYLEDYQPLLDELAIILQFQNINEKAKKIADHVKVLNPDKFGAKQTIYSTRKVLKDIGTLIRSKEAEFLKVGDKTLIEAIYPGVAASSTGGINIPLYMDGDNNASVYKPLDAFLRYSTVPSILINQTLFATEQEDFVKAIEHVESFTGEAIDEQVYNDFKKYILVWGYKNRSSIIREAIDLDKNGNIIIDYQTGIDEQSGLPVEEEEDVRLQKELSRVYGFNHSAVLNYEVDDINNPTEEELREFRQLSPAQKVTFIQSNLSGNDRTIFEYLKTNLYNEWEVRKKNISSQTIRFEDQQTDMNVIYDLFEECFYNENPFIRLTAIDLIKYAFIVEGFNFRKGNITKIIKNNALYTDIHDGGTGIIDDIRGMVDEIHMDFLHNETMNLYEDYIRSHSTIKQIKNYRVRYIGNRPSIAHVGGTYGMYHFNLSNDSDTNIAKEIGIIKEVKRNGVLKNELSIQYINIHNKNKTTLYKIAPVLSNGEIVDVYMYPLNLLESYESGEFSSNPNNNIYAPARYYEAVINVLQSDVTVPIKQLVDNKHTLFDYKTVKGYKYVTPKVKKESVVPTDEHFITKLASESGHTPIKQNLIDRINDAMFNSEDKKGEEVIYCWVKDEALKNAFKNSGVISIQTIADKNGVPHQYAISKLPRKAINDKLTKRLNSTQLLGITLAQRNGVKVMEDIYCVRKYTPKQEPVKEEEVAHSSINIDDFGNEPSVSGKLAQQMLNDMRMRARNNSDELALSVYKDIKAIGFDEHNRINIENKKTDTIRMAINYYRTAARRINNEMKEFMPSPDGDPNHWLSIEDLNVIDALATDENLRNRYISLILQASTFGKAIDLIFQVPEEELTDETKKLINELKTEITNLRTSKTVANGFNVINRKIWSELSTNPLIKDGYTDIVDYITRDASTLDWLFQDTQELAIPIIQVILNQVKSKFNTRLMEIEPQVIAYKKEEQRIIDAARAAGMTINWNNIVNPDSGRFILDYDEKIFDDDRELELKVRHAREDFGEFSKEYLKAKHERDAWLLENKEQQYVSEYYQAVYDNESRVLTDFMIDYYIQYLKYKNEYHSLLGISKNNRTAEHNDRIRFLRHTLAQMTDVQDDVTGEYKDDVLRTKAVTLNAYINEVDRIKKAFFVRETRLGFQKDLEHYTKIIKKYDIVDSRGRHLRTQFELLQIPEYAEAVDWINENTRYTPSEDFIKQLNAAYKIMSGGKKRKYPQFEHVMAATPKAKDIYGVINGRVFSERQIEAIKQEQETIYNDENDKIYGENKLIRNKSDNDEIYSAEFYNGFKTSNTQINNTKNAIIKQINAILVNAVHPNTGKIQLSSLSIDELKSLSILYDKLFDIKFEEEKDPKVKKFIKDNVEFKTDDVAYANDRAAAEERDKTEKGYLKAFYKVASLKEYSEGILVGQNRSKGNTDIYGYVTPKHKADGTLVNPNFLDKEKTDARRFITDNVEMIPTSYYYEAREAAAQEGKLAEWERANHVYNPHTRQMEPIRIWTRRKYKEHVNSERVPTYSNTKSTPQEHTVNEKFDRFTSNYKTRPGSPYYRATQANQYEQELRDLMVNTIRRLSNDNHTAMRFMSQDFAPRRGRVAATLVNSAYSLANALGYGQSLDPDRHFSKFVGYERDKEANIPMLNHIKAKGYKQYEPIREKAFGETDEHYQEEVRKIREHNEEIRKHNLAIEAAAMDKDYSSVMEQFVREALLTQARQESKLEVYYLLEYLRSQHKAYQTNTFGGLSVDKQLSTEDGKVYETASPKRATEMVETWAKRFLFDEHRPKAKFDKVAAVAQNIASAKFMMLNITGGIGNLLTGSANIFMERFADEYFSHSAWESAKFNYYVPNSFSFIGNSHKATTDNLTDGIIKLMSVVDYNDITETARSTDAIQIIEHARDWAYSPQTAGEHFMQNTAMLAMMIDNRVIDVNGKKTIMSFAAYTRDVEYNIMKALLANDAKLTKLYEDFVKDIHSDKNKLKEYHWFNRDINAEFLRSIAKLNEDTKEIAKEYAKKVKEKLETVKATFDTQPKLIDQFELNKETGLVELKASSGLTLGDLGKFKERVVSTNKKIHGVYDKLGGAQIESRWVFGSLLMQYHKYIYMGFMKHWRMNGYYNESRESIERGFIQSLWSFASIEFRDIKKRTKAEAEKDNITKFQAGIQVICQSFLNTYLNWTFNKNTMSMSEARNMRRVLGDFTAIAFGLLSAIAANCAIIGIDDDDEIMLGIANLALYQADRLSSEVAVFSTGALSEIKKLYSNPVAIGSSITDLAKAFGFITEYIMSGDEFNPYYTTGINKGEHKLKVLLERQIPIHRNIERIRNINQNNKYYKLGDNMLSVVPTKDIAKWIME